MFKEEFEGNWHKFKGKIQEKWGKFTHDDIARMNGKYEQFLGELQKKYGYSREQAEREFKTWCESCRNKSHTDKESPRGWDQQKPNRDDQGYKKRKAG